MKFLLDMVGAELEAGDDSCLVIDCWDGLRIPLSITSKLVVICWNDMRSIFVKIWANLTQSIAYFQLLIFSSHKIGLYSASSSCAWKYGSIHFAYRSFIAKLRPDIFCGNFSPKYKFSKCQKKIWAGRWGIFSFNTHENPKTEINKKYYLSSTKVDSLLF